MSEAFEAQGLFSGVYTASLMAGEKSGSLEQVLRRYVQHMKMLQSARSQLISALIYPLVLVLMASAVVSLIVFKVVPEFAKFYAQEKNGAALPMSELKVRAEVASGGVVLSGKVDLLLMRPDPSGGRKSQGRNPVALLIRRFVSWSDSEEGSSS